MTNCKWLKIPTFILGFVFTCICLVHNASAAEYVSPEGIKFTSQARAWDSETKLQKLYQELVKNTHGEELPLLQSVEIHADYPKGNGVAGEYRFQASSDLMGRKKMLPGRIDLYGGNDRTTIESVAKTLSHEYGHHVTHYYSIKQDGFSLTDPALWTKSTYVKTRGLANHPKVNKLEEHRWQIGEIAAEDYVQLFGSPTAKQVHPFTSRFETLQKGKETQPIRWDASMYNVAPQENYELPLAAEVPGLYDWFADNLKVQKKPQLPTQPELKIQQVRTEGQSGHQFLFEWTARNPAGSGTVYTFVSYADGDILPEPVVTRKAGEPLQAQYGTVVIHSPLSILTYKDPNAEGVRNFRVYAQNAQGYTVSSPVLTVDLDHPDKVTVTKLQTVKQPEADSVPLSVQTVKPFGMDLSGWEQVILQGVSQTVNFASKVLQEAFKLLK